MAKRIVPPAAVAAGEPIDDPIAKAQLAVMECKALLECVECMVEGGNGFREIDLVAACSGIIGLMDKIIMDLDPQEFRKAVLASAPVEVPHG